MIVLKIQILSYLYGTRDPTVGPKVDQDLFLGFWG